MKKVKKIIGLLIIVGLAVAGARLFQYFQENKILKEVIVRLEADSRIAEVLVTGLDYDEKRGNVLTTIKFLEYDTGNNPLEPRYFKFTGNVIQFQSLVIRFKDAHIRAGDKLKGKSVYLFWKAFMLDGSNTQEYEITEVDAIPEGYKLKTPVSGDFEKNLWKKFWEYALDPEKAAEMGIKNAQIEAPGTMFVPGMLYTIKIEHDGGMRIDTTPIPKILKGEKIP